MKKMTTLLLAFVLAACLFTGALAEENGFVKAYKEIGLTVAFPGSFDSTRGVFYPYPQGLVADGVWNITFYYIAMPAQDYEEMQARDEQGELTAEDMDRLSRSVYPLAEVIAIDGGRGSADIIELFSLEYTADHFTQIGQAEDTSFFNLENPKDTEDFLSGIDSEFAEEYRVLHDQMLEALSQADYAKPAVRGWELIGRTMSFETTDLEGNPVISSELFAQHEVTMINFWTTWCIYCKREMPGLAEISRHLEEKNAAIIGICLDADTELDACKEILEENQVEYPNLLPPEGLAEEWDIYSYPISFFVDSQGVIIAPPVYGAPADVAVYETQIDKLLDREDTEAEEKSVLKTNGEGLYRVFLSDGEGNPVEGAVVQFCSDDSCMMGSSDANGQVDFEAEEGSYTIHILKVPEGYKKCDEEFATGKSYSDLYIVLNKGGVEE